MYTDIKKIALVKRSKQATKRLMARLKKEKALEWLNGFAAGAFFTFVWCAVLGSIVIGMGS